MSEPSQPQQPAPEAAPEDSIGQRIAERRQAKGLTHDGVSQLTKLLDKQGQTGISRTTIRGYEVGLYKPGTRELRLLSEALEVSPTWLIFGTSSDAPASSGQGVPLPQSLSEWQKLLTALSLLPLIDSSDRQVVYDVLNSIARHKLGETAYRTNVISTTELGALLGDVWADMKEGRSLDQAQMQALVLAYEQHIGDIVERQLGMNLAAIRALASKQTP